MSMANLKKLLAGVKKDPDTGLPIRIHRPTALKERARAVAQMNAEGVSPVRRRELQKKIDRLDEIIKRDDKMADRNRMPVRGGRGTPSRSVDGPPKKMARGGMVRKGKMDYRKGGMVYK